MRGQITWRTTLKFNRKYLATAALVGSLAVSALLAGPANAMIRVEAGATPQQVPTPAQDQDAKTKNNDNDNDDDGLDSGTASPSPANHSARAASAADSTPMRSVGDNLSDLASPDGHRMNDSAVVNTPLVPNSHSPVHDDRQTPLDRAPQADADNAGLMAPPSSADINDDPITQALAGTRAQLNLRLVRPHTAAHSQVTRTVAQALNLYDGGVRLQFTDGTVVVDFDPIPRVGDSDASNATTGISRRSDAGSSHLSDDGELQRDRSDEFQLNADPAHNSLGSTTSDAHLAALHRDFDDYDVLPTRLFRANAVNHNHAAAAATRPQTRRLRVVPQVHRPDNWIMTPNGTQIPFIQDVVSSSGSTSGSDAGNDSGGEGSFG